MKICKLSIFLLLIFLLMSFSGCTKTNANDAKEVLKKPIRVEVAINEEITETLDYIGIVTADEYIKYSSKIPGEIREIFVEKDQRIRKGDKLFAVDDSDLKVLQSSCKLKLNQSKSLLKKAEEMYMFADDNYKRISKLYKNASIDEVTYDKAKLKLKTTKQDYETAKKNYELAKLNYNKTNKDVFESIVYGTFDGYVTKILFKEDEITSVGMPVIVVRKDEDIVNMGITADDLEKIRLEDKVKIFIDDRETSGIIVEISKEPDVETRLFPVKIVMEDNKFPIGSIVNVHVIVEKNYGVKVPLTAIGTDKKDYVYVVSDDIAIKKEVNIIRSYDEFVLVKGINDYDNVVVEGMRALSEGDRINILK